MSAPVYMDTSGHLWSADRDALHAVATRAGLKREWFQDRPRLYHYDAMTRFMRARCLQVGAIRVTPRTLVKLIQEADA